MVFAWWTKPKNSSVDLWIHDLRPEIDVSRQVLFCCPNRISSTTLCGYDDVWFTVFQSSSENSARTRRLGSAGNYNESTSCETVAPCISCDIFVASSWHSLLYDRTLLHDRLVRAARELQTLSPKFRNGWLWSLERSRSGWGRHPGRSGLDYFVQRASSHH